MIVALSSNLIWFASPLTTKNNSKILGIFREKLFLSIKLDFEKELQNWAIILDNSRIHKTENILNICKKSGEIIAFFHHIHHH